MTFKATAVFLSINIVCVVWYKCLRGGVIRVWVTAWTNSMANVVDNLCGHQVAHFA